MPPQQAAIKKYSRRTIKHVNNALSKTKIHTVKARIEEKWKEPILLSRINQKNFWYPRSKIYTFQIYIPYTKERNCTHKSLKFFIQRALRRRFDCFLKWNELSCIVAVLSTRSSIRSPLSNIFSILSTIIVRIWMIVKILMSSTMW